MNSETGEIKELKDLTDAERKSDKWIEFGYGIQRVNGTPIARPATLSKSDLKREQYMEKVKAKHLAGAAR